MNDDIVNLKIPAPATTETAANEPAAQSDLSSQIERAVAREPNDSVRCKRVFGDYYRCNWWSRKGQPRKGQDFDWGGLISDHVRKSRFLRATTQRGLLEM